MRICCWHSACNIFSFSNLSIVHLNKFQVDQVNAGPPGFQSCLSNVCWSKILTTPYVQLQVLLPLNVCLQRNVKKREKITLTWISNHSTCPIHKVFRNVLSSAASPDCLYQKHIWLYLPCPSLNLEWPVWGPAWNVSLHCSLLTAYDMICLQNSTSLKLVFNTALPLRCLHKVLWRHWKHLLLGKTLFANMLKHCNLGSTNICPQTLSNASDWLVWTSMWSWHQVTEWANWPWHSAIFHFYLTLPL